MYVFIHRLGRKKHTRKHTTRKIEKKHKNNALTERYNLYQLVLLCFCVVSVNKDSYVNPNHSP